MLLYRQRITVELSQVKVSQITVVARFGLAFANSSNSTTSSCPLDAAKKRAVCPYCFVCVCVCWYVYMRTCQHVSLCVFICVCQLWICGVWMCGWLCMQMPIFSGSSFQVDILWVILACVPQNSEVVTLIKQVLRTKFSLIVDYRIHRCIGCRYNILCYFQTIPVRTCT